VDIVYVDSDDKEIGTGSIDDAYNNGIIVRISRVFLTNSKGELLIQKRSDKHPSLPGRWDQSAAGHVDKNETYEDAAYRELFEEMGIKNVKLHRMKKFYTEETDDKAYIKKRFNAVFVGTFNGEVKIDNKEVSNYQWILPGQLAKRMVTQPNDFTEGFIKAFEIYRTLARLP
jgi:isopentenyldiphosphate isomerase